MTCPRSPRFKIAAKPSDKPLIGLDAVWLSFPERLPIATVPAIVGQPVIAAQPVWERVWNYQPSDEKDDLLLARERQSQRWRLIVDHLQMTFGSLAHLRTIELGSGRGDLSLLLAERGAQVTLLDQNRSVLEQARRRFSRLGLPLALEQGDMFSLDALLRESFDVALSSGVIEHFRGSVRTEALRVHGNVLRPGGMAIVSVPQVWCVPYRLWKLYLELRSQWPYGVEVPYSQRELSRRAGQAGLVPLTIRGLEFRRGWEQLRRALWKTPMEINVAASRLDSWMGLALVLIARREGDWQAT